MDNETENTDMVEEQDTGEEIPGDPEDEVFVLKAKAGELERIITEKDTEIAALKKSDEELEEKCRTLTDSLAEAVSGYKKLVVNSNPIIPGEMIDGDCIAAVDASLEKAKTLLSKVRQGLEMELNRTKVPAGSPERGTPDLSGLSAGEKIRYALGGNE